MFICYAHFSFTRLSIHLKCINNIKVFNHSNIFLALSLLLLLSRFSRVWLCDPMDCSPPGSSVHGILQARMLEWVAVPSPGDLPDPGIKSRSLALQADSLLSEPPGKPWQYRAMLEKQTWARLPGFQRLRLSLTIQAALSTRLNFPLLTSPMRSPDTHELTAVGGNPRLLSLGSCSIDPFFFLCNLSS